MRNTTAEYLPPVGEFLLAQEVGELIGSQFELDTTKSYGATESANKVFFGTVDGVDVAVKPFCELGTRERAEHEAQMMKHFTRLGLETFKPLGVYEGSLAAYLVTEFVPDISTMNQIGWEQSITPLIYTYSHLPLLQRFGAFTGDMHAHDVTHGDWQPKNVARHRTGQFLVPDLEKAQFCTDMSDEQRVPAFAYDIGRLASGLLQRGFLQCSEWATIEQVLTDNYIDPYITTLERMGVDTDIHLEAVSQALWIIKLSHEARSTQA